MIKVRYHSDAMCYTLTINDLGIGDVSRFPIKFDTGATSTVIGIYTLFNRISPNNIQKLKDGFEKAGIQPRDFSSATGHQLLGYPCKVHGVDVSGHILEDFYFHLVLDTKRKLSLLGNDFISCCNFKHEIDSNILIEDYDLKSYSEKFCNTTCFDVNELHSPIRAVLLDVITNE